MLNDDKTRAVSGREERAPASAVPGQESEAYQLRIQQLLDGLRAGAAARRQAVGALYDEFSGRIRRYFRNHGADAAQAEDWLQEVFVRLLRSMDGFRGDGSQFIAWLWTVARNILFDASRRSGRRVVDIDDVPEEEHPEMEQDTPAELLERESVRACVRQGLQRFIKENPERAQCVSWLASDHLSMAEIAGILGRTPGATREFLSQCRKKLRPYLALCFGLPDT